MGVMTRVLGLSEQIVYSDLVFRLILQFIGSEDDEPMDEDGNPKTESQNDDLSQYNLDEYDKESMSIGECASMLPSPPLMISAATGPFSNIKGLTYYKDDEDDPYITLKEVRPETYHLLS